MAGFIRKKDGSTVVMLTFPSECKQPWLNIEAVHSICAIAKK